MIEEGVVAPGFRLRNAAGEQVALADFAGRPVVLYFYPRDATPGCTAEACGFRDLWQPLCEAGAVVLGVSPDSPESHRAFAAKYELPFPLLSDPDKKVMRKYGAFGGEGALRPQDRGGSSVPRF